MPARRLCESFKRLRSNLNRGRTLLKRFFDNPGGKPRGVGQPTSDEQELLRSVLVVSIAALDAFLSEFVAEFLPKLARKDNVSGIFDKLAKESPGLILRALFLEEDVPRHEILSEVIESHFLGQTMQGPNAVRQVSYWCGLELGDNAFDNREFHHAMKTLKTRTNERHRIVHRGEKVRLSRSEIGKTVELVQHVGKVLNDAAIRQYG